MKVQSSVISLTFIAALLLAISATGLGQQVRYNYVRGTDFSKYKTYRWVKLEQLDYPAPEIEQKIRRSIDEILSARGLKRVEDGQCDLLAIYQAGLTQQKQWNAYKSSDGYWDYGGWYGWGGGRPRAATFINVGTLNLDFYDVALRKQVWRGEATKTLDPPKDPEKLQAKIDNAMAKLLRNFPRPKAED